MGKLSSHVLGLYGFSRFHCKNFWTSENYFKRFLRIVPPSVFSHLSFFGLFFVLICFLYVSNACLVFYINHTFIFDTKVTKDVVDLHPADASQGSTKERER